MNSVIVFAVLLGISYAAPSREKRQVNCIDPFKNVPSPCVSNPTNKVYFPHPTDNTKFLQCDIYNRMYVIQCPAGEVWESTLDACRPANAAVTQPTAAPFVPVATAGPVTQRPVTGNNPCSATAISRGQLYFAVAGDNSRFIECDLAGNPSLLTCPTNLLWDQGMLSCVYPINAGGNVPVNPTSALPTNLQNPCTAQAVSSGHFFFPHPDATKFIQCDLWGQSFVVSCPSNLIWNAYLETCYRPIGGGAIITNQG